MSHYQLDNNSNSINSSSSSNISSSISSSSSNINAANATQWLTVSTFFEYEGRAKYANQSFVTQAGSNAQGRTTLVTFANRRSNKGHFPCDKCGKHLSSSYNLKRHMLTHLSPTNSQPAKTCPACSKTYTTVAALNMHLLTHNPAHRCDTCGKCFSRLFSLKEHMLYHAGIKPFGCGHCGHAFTNRSNLRAHLKQHIGKTVQAQFWNKKCFLHTQLINQLEQDAYTKELKDVDNHDNNKGQIQAWQVLEVELDENIGESNIRLSNHHFNQDNQESSSQFSSDSSSSFVQNTIDTIGASIQSTIGAHNANHLQPISATCNSTTQSNVEHKMAINKISDKHAKHMHQSQARVQPFICYSDLSDLED